MESKSPNLKIYLSTAILLSIFSLGCNKRDSSITPKKPKIPLTEAISQPIERWKDVLFNDFEPHLFRNHPQLAAIKQQLYDKGANYAAMSGSGSTIFGLFDKEIDFTVEGCTVFSAKL